MNYVTFEDGIRYPWVKPKKLWYGLWILVPIVGWLALVGFWAKIIRALVNGKRDGVPEWGTFSENFMDGMMVFVKLLPLMIVVSLIEKIPLIGYPVYILASIFLIPFLVVNMIYTGKFEESFNLKKAWDIVVVKHISDYLIVFLKTLGFVVIYGILSIVLVGIPCLMFGEYYYICDFYANTATKKKAKK